MFTQNLVICNFYFNRSLDILKTKQFTKNQKKMVKTTLALLGLAEAEHCNFEMNTYSNSDCSGSAITVVFADDVKIGECAPYLGSLVIEFSECSSSKLKFTVYEGLH